MLFIIAPAAAAIVAIANPCTAVGARSRINSRHYIGRHHPRRHHKLNGLDSSIAPRQRSSKLDRYKVRCYSRGPRDRTAATRVARMTRLALLQRRETMLRDFLIMANTETPIFRDERTYHFESGIEVGPAEVTQDFLGSPIIRVRVQNLQQTELSILLEAQVITTQGARGRAAATVSLHAGESRTIELLCPEKVAPASLVWTALRL